MDLREQSPAWLCEVQTEVCVQRGMAMGISTQPCTNVAGFRLSERCQVTMCMCVCESVSLCGSPPPLRHWSSERERSRTNLISWESICTAAHGMPCVSIVRLRRACVLFVQLCVRLCSV